MLTRRDFITVLPAGIFALLMLKNTSAFALSKKRSVLTIQIGHHNGVEKGQSSFYRIPFDCKILGWSLVADKAGKIVIDLRRTSFALFPASAIDSIVSDNKPSLNGKQKQENFNLEGWQLYLRTGDVLSFYVESAEGITNTTLSIFVELR